MANNKTLTLRCECGESKTFRAPNVDGMIEQIDASGWRDMPPLTAKINAMCPTCDAREVSASATADNAGEHEDGTIDAENVREPFALER